MLAVGGSIWGVSGQDHTKRDTAGSIVTAGQLGVFVTHLGDCFESLPGNSGVVSTVEAVPCISPHHWQVVYKGSVSDPNYDDQTLNAESRAVCTDQTTSLSKKMDQAILNEYSTAIVGHLWPSVESWAKGDRAVTCLIGSNTASYSDSLLQ